MSDPVQDLADCLSADGTLKLWSVLVTCLGDVSRGGTVEVSGRALSALIERLGLQPQAMRVALHRLKRDGWIESRREGRVGFHGLSQSAKVQARAVERRIYGRGVDPEEWSVVGLPPDEAAGLAALPDTLSAVSLSRSFALLSGPRDDIPQDWLVTKPTDRDLPDWVRDIVVDAACEDGFMALERAVRAVAVVPEEGLDRFALRVLVVHGWRRLILRSNPAAEAALGGTRAEVTCRLTVHDLLERLGVPTASFLQDLS